MSAQPTSSGPPRSALSPRWVARVAVAVALRPSLWATALRQVGRLAPPGWWRRRPFLPLPTADYLAFRSQTMYGGSGQAPDARDVCTYLAWCRDFPRLGHGRRATPKPRSAPAGGR